MLQERKKENKESRCWCRPGMCAWIWTVEYDQRNWNVSVKHSRAHARPCGMNQPILSARRAWMLSLSPSHAHEKLVLSLSRDPLVLFVIGACQRLYLLECLCFCRASNWKIVATNVTSFVHSYHLDCRKSPSHRPGREQREEHSVLSFFHIFVLDSVICQHLS